MRNVYLVLIGLCLFLILCLAVGQARQKKPEPRCIFGHGRIICPGDPQWVKIL